MSPARQTTIRFGEELYNRLALASEQTGLPINSIVIVACMDWLKREMPRLAYLPRPPVVPPAAEESETEDEQ